MSTPKTVSSASLSDELANALVLATVNHGRSVGLKLCAAVVDLGGNLQAFLRGNGALLSSVSISQDKAYTAANFGRPTGDVSDAIANRSALLRADFGNRPHMALFAGGLPIVVDGVLVGGLGVSGATSQEDAISAAAGLAAIGL
jgi:uncharacterized protein GlcG (DUF336 family)